MLAAIGGGALLAGTPSGLRADTVEWTLADILASRSILAPDTIPVMAGDALDRFVIIGEDKRMVTIVDGESAAPIQRFRHRSELQSAPSFSSDGRHAALIGRDGWITLYDLRSLAPRAELRAGIEARGAAFSGDGRFIMVANARPPMLAVLDGRNLAPIKLIAVEDERRRSAAAAIRAAPARESFLVAPADIAELWEVSYSDRPPYRGWVHDHRDDGPPESRARFPVRRIPLAAPLDDVAFDPAQEHVIGFPRGRGEAQLIDLYIGRRFAGLALGGAPRGDGAIAWMRGTVPVIAVSEGGNDDLSIVDMAEGTVIERLQAPGPGAVTRHHPALGHAWVVGADAMQLLDKETLRLGRVLRPRPGRPIAFVEFDRRGRRALVGVVGSDSVTVLDTATLAEVARIAVPDAARAYNVGNRRVQGPRAMP